MSKPTAIKPKLDNETELYAKISSHRTYVKLRERREDVLEAINKSLKQQGVKIAERQEGFYLTVTDKKQAGEVLTDFYKEPEEVLTFFIGVLTRA